MESLTTAISRVGGLIPMIKGFFKAFVEPIAEHLYLTNLMCSIFLVSTKNKNLLYDSKSPNKAEKLKDYFDKKGDVEK